MSKIELDRGNYRKGVLITLSGTPLLALVYLLRKTILHEVSPLVIMFCCCLPTVVFTRLIFRVSFADAYESFRRFPFHCFFLSFCGVALGSTLMLAGLGQLDLGIATVLAKLQPIFTLILARVFLGERIPAKMIPWICLAILSSYFVVSSDPFLLSLEHSSALGVLFALGAGLSWACATVYGKSLLSRNIPPSHLLLIRFSIGGLCLAPLLFCLPSSYVQWAWSDYVLAIVLLSSLLNAIELYLYYEGMKYIPAGLSSALELTYVIYSVLLGVVFLNESLTVWQTLGVAGVLTAIYRIVH